MAPVFAYAFDIAGAPAKPRLCFVATASGDKETTIQRFYSAFEGSDIQTSHLALFDKPNVSDVAAHLHEQDVVWVDRGSIVNLLTVWRAHQLDNILHECWQAGVVLAGESAGSLCWHTSGTTDSFGEVRGFRDALGFLPYANAVHYAERRDLFHQLIGAGELTAGYATDAGAGLHYAGAKLVTAIADRKNAGAYWVERQGDGSVREEELDVQRLKR